jgi:hypothetical protein
VKQLLIDYNIERFSPSPACNDLFDQSEDQTLLPESESTRLHSGVAKLLYLSTRIRPDIQMAVNYLCTRVNCYTTIDQLRFERILEYLYATMNKTLTLSTYSLTPIHLVVYADASFGIHIDGKSHSGICVTLGRGAIYSRSTKQKIVTRSSTEAELVAANDSSTILFALKQFISQLGFQSSLVICQDNRSTIRLLTDTESIRLASKHINIKFFYLWEKYQNGELDIVHVPTEKMVADILTKPLLGMAFRQMRSLLLNDSI